MKLCHVLSWILTESQAFQFFQFVWLDNLAIVQRTTDSNGEYNIKYSKSIAHSRLGSIGRCIQLKNS